ncbi:hypothetical protein N8J89_29565 [Crossiella sp. CA-258035]|uniref:hypothetical protein n=1 Tax=Crossiella sp. CA-258035 TaxID=2981138 RepID=UPI0024BC61C6|nr:hypothetical protein [Crossiella sp. CA-258035]WHT17254.1 hypothetical protein N8J89_29565 [Crossiella sp. CA-258035]
MVESVRSDLPQGCLGPFTAWLRRSAQPPPPPMPHPVRGIEVRDWQLPSSVPGVDFHLTGQIFWQVLAGKSFHPDLENLARHAVHQRVASVTSAGHPAHHVSLRIRLNTELGESMMDPTGRIAARAEDLTLSLADGALERIQRYQDLLLAKAVWDLESQLERDRTRYFRQEVLRDTSSAAAWWLARNPAGTGEAAAMVEHLGHWVRAVNGPGDPEPAPAGPPLTAAVTELAADMDESSRQLFVNHLARVLEQYGRVRAGAELRLLLPQVTNGSHAPPR